jgi:hypothetical protein
VKSQEHSKAKTGIQTVDQAKNWLGQLALKYKTRWRILQAFRNADRLLENKTKTEKYAIHTELVNQHQLPLDQAAALALLAQEFHPGSFKVRHHLLGSDGIVEAISFQSTRATKIPQPHFWNQSEEEIKEIIIRERQHGLSKFQPHPGEIVKVNLKEILTEQRKSNLKTQIKTLIDCGNETVQAKLVGYEIKVDGIKHQLSRADKFYPMPERTRQFDWKPILKSPLLGTFTCSIAHIKA